MSDGTEMFRESIRKINDSLYQMAFDVYRGRIEDLRELRTMKNVPRKAIKMYEDLIEQSKRQLLKLAERQIKNAD